MKKYTVWLAVLTVASLLLASCDRAGGDIPLPNGGTQGSDTADTALQTTPTAPGGDDTSDAETTAPSGGDTSDIIQVPDPFGPSYFLPGGHTATLSPIQLSDIAELAFHPTNSYAKDGYIYMRADYMGMDEPNAFYFVEQPAYLTIKDYEEWKAFLAKADGSEEIGELGGINEAYFSDRALILLFPAGISGSARYRIDGVQAADGKLSVTLTTVAERHVTMDIVHWCVMIPVEKEHAELSVELIARNAQNGSEETEAILDPALKPRDDEN